MEFSPAIAVPYLDENSAFHQVGGGGVVKIDVDWMISGRIMNMLAQ